MALGFFRGEQLPVDRFLTAALPVGYFPKFASMQSLGRTIFGGPETMDEQREKRIGRVENPMDWVG